MYIPSLLFQVDLRDARKRWRLWMLFIALWWMVENVIILLYLLWEESGGWMVGIVHLFLALLHRGNARAGLLSLWL